MTRHSLNVVLHREPSREAQLAPAARESGSAAGMSHDRPELEAASVAPRPASRRPRRGCDLPAVSVNRFTAPRAEPPRPPRVDSTRPVNLAVPAAPAQPGPAVSGWLERSWSAAAATGGTQVR